LASSTYYARLSGKETKREHLKRATVMASGSTSTKKMFDSRKKNLRFYRSQKQAVPPSFLSEDTPEKREQNPDENHSDTSSTLLTPSPSKPIVIIMSKKSIFLFFFTVALVAILCFAAGFLVSYISFGPKPAMVTSERSLGTDGKKREVKSLANAGSAHSFFSLAAYTVCLGT